MGNTIGYNFTTNWSLTDAAMLTANFNYGGLHQADSRVKIQTESAYWEVYGEWAQEVSNRFDFRIGLDYGKIDPEFEKVTFRTLAAEIKIGPFKQKHSFGIILEGQLNDKPFSIDMDTSTHTQYGFNLLTTLSYGFSPWLTIAGTLEREVELDRQDKFYMVSEISSKLRHYASIGLNVKPFPNHEITLEYGSMSGGKKCTLGTCVDLPPFKGFKCTLISRF
jgi:hypothetical protein